MRSVNKVILVGNLTRDPEVRTAGNGSIIVTFGIATNREWVGTEGDKKQLTEYHNLVCFGRLGELSSELLKKGNLVYIEGYLKTRSWEHPESGAKIFRTEIVAMDMILLEKRRGNEADPVSMVSGKKFESTDIHEDDFFADLDDIMEPVRGEGDQSEK